MLCTGGAGSLVGGPMGLLAGGAAVGRGSASAAAERTGLGTRGVTAGCSHAGCCLGGGG